MAINLSNTKKIITNIDTTITAPTGTSRLNFNNYVYATKFFGDGSGLTGTPQPSVAIFGDVTGSGTTSIPLTLATITQGTGSSFVKITLDTKGRVIGNTPVSLADITSSLGFTPYNSTNPSGYINANTSNSFSTVQTFISIKETKVNMDSPAVTAIALDSGSYFTKTISATTTFTINGTLTAGVGRSFILELVNAGGYTLSFFGSKWSGGVAPTLTTNGRDVLGFYCHDGVTWNAMLLAKDIR